MLSEHRNEHFGEGRATCADGEALLLLSEASYMLPAFLSDESAWVQHIPFAFALIEWMQPRTVVELGTHHGDSFLAFCQAVAKLRISTRVTAIDTWVGDTETGYYDEDVLKRLRVYQQSRYGHFSTLMPSSFAEAAAAFPAGSIDLLHLDGSHAEASVREDLRTWLPKMSDAGVILMHDTQLHREGSGVARVWAELCETYPHFEFRHGFGLGMAVVGDHAAAGVTQFLERATVSPGIVQGHFSALGQRVELLRGIRLLTGRRGGSTEAPARALPVVKDLVNAQNQTHFSQVRRTLRLASWLPLMARLASRIPWVRRYFRTL